VKINNCWVKLAGQQSFRKSYLEQELLPEYIQNMTKFMYVIDIQDIARYEESLNYLAELIPFLKNKEKLEFVVFLHKFDPPLAGQKDFEQDVLDQKIIQPVINLVPNHFDLQIYSSTIFTIFQKTRWY
jgi:hypothetical protein